MGENGKIGRRAEQSGWIGLSSGRETKLGHRVQTHCHAAVSTNDRNADRRGQRDISELLSKKGRSTDDIQSGDAEKPGTSDKVGEQIIHVIKCGLPMIPLWIEGTVLLQDLGNNWNSRVDRVGNHKNESIRARFGNPGGKITDDASVDLANKRVSVLVSTGEGL